MSSFVVIVALLSLLAAAVVLWPLLARPAQRGPVAGWAAAIVGLLVVGGSAALYVTWSNWGWTPVSEDGTPASMVSRLARRLERNPDDLAGWLLLGKSYAQLEQYPMSVRAYRRAERLSEGRSVEALTGLAESLILAKQSDLDGQAGRLFEQALQLEPRSTKALFYSAIAAMERGEKPLARSRFELLLAGDPPPQVRQLISDTLRNLQEPSATSSPAAQTAAKPAPKAAAAANDADVASVQLRVSVAPELAGKVQPGAPLFVLARTPGKPGPPLAAQRLQAQFPQTVRLSAADAMLAGTGFVRGQEIEVAARISNSGGALAKPGDPFGTARVTVGKGGIIDVRIDQITP